MDEITQKLFNALKDLVEACEGLWGSDTEWIVADEVAAAEILIAEIETD